MANFGSFKLNKCISFHSLFCVKMLIWILAIFRAINGGKIKVLRKNAFFEFWQYFEPLTGAKFGHFWILYWQQTIFIFIILFGIICLFEDLNVWQFWIPTDSNQIFISLVKAFSWRFENQHFEDLLKIEH